jgi:predicted Ser/Thr protein kinase
VKDEKNRDCTELTGDINYRKIAGYGSASADWQAHWAFA